MSKRKKFLIFMVWTLPMAILVVGIAADTDGIWKHIFCGLAGGVFGFAYLFRP